MKKSREPSTIRDSFGRIIAHDDGKRRRTSKRGSYCHYNYEYLGFAGADLARPRTHVCASCHFTAKSNSPDCPNCHSTGTMKRCGLTARPPKRHASKKKWKEFWTKWVNAHPKGCR